MARIYDVNPTPGGGYEAKKRQTHKIAWPLFAFLVFAALLQPNVAVKIVGGVFALITIVALVVRASTRK